MTDDEIVVPAAFVHALNVLDRHLAASRDLTAAITAINEYSVDIDDDAMAVIEQERFRHNTSADAIAGALQVMCPGKHALIYHRLNASELYNRTCAMCGAKIVVEGAKQ